MKILLDECVPRQLRWHLAPHQPKTVSDMGWSGIKNGQLLALAESAGFDLLLTVDTNIPKQQNLQWKTLAILIVRSHSNRRKDLIAKLPAVLIALDNIKPGQVLVIEV